MGELAPAQRRPRHRLVVGPSRVAATLLQPPASAGGKIRWRRVSGVAAKAVAPTALWPLTECIPPAEAGGWGSVAASRLGDMFRRLLGGASWLLVSVIIRVM